MSSACARAERLNRRIFVLDDAMQTKLRLLSEEMFKLPVYQISCVYVAATLSYCVLKRENKYFSKI